MEAEAARWFPGPCPVREDGLPADWPCLCLSLAQGRGLGGHPGACRHTRRGSAGSGVNPHAHLAIETATHLRRGPTDLFWRAGVYF